MYTRFCASADKFAAALARDYAYQGKIRIEVEKEFFDRLSLALLSDSARWFTAKKPKFPCDSFRMQTMVGPIEVASPREIVTLRASHRVDHWLLRDGKMEASKLKEYELRNIAGQFADFILKEGLIHEDEQHDNGYHRTTDYSLDILKKGKL